MFNYKIYQIFLQVFSNFDSNLKIMYKKQNTFPTLFLCASILLLSQGYSQVINNITVVPTISTLHVINTSTLAPIIKFQAYGNYVYRFSNDNKIHVWDMSDVTFPNPKFVASPFNTIIDFAIQETTGAFSYLDNLGNVVIIKIVDGSIEAAFNVGFSSNLSCIQMSWFSIFVTLPGNSTSSPQLYRYSRTNQTLLTVVSMYQLINDIRIAKCIKPITPVYQFVIGWDNTSYLQMYTFGDGWSNVYGSRNFTKNITWAITDFEWSDWCQKYTVTYQSLKQSTIYRGDNGSIVNSYTFTQNIYSSNLFDPNKLILAAFLQDSTVQFLDTSQPGNHVFLTQTYSNLSYYNKFSQNSSTFFVATDVNIFVYLIGCTNSYSEGIGLCSLCNANGVCYQNTANTSSNSSQNNNSFSNNPIQKVSFMKDYLQQIMTVIGYTIMLMQCTPFINYFLRFINFWSICSMYILLNISLYQYFYQIMVQFYQILNISIFQILNLNFPWPQFGQNKINGKYYDQFQLSTNFMDNLQQPFIMTISCAISIYLYNKLMQVLCSQNTYKKYKLHFYIGIQSSFISQMNNFIPSLSILFIIFYQSNFFEQINLILYTLLVFSSVMCPFAILLLNGQKVKKNTVIAPKSTHFVKPSNLKYKSIISHLYFDLFYVSLINIFIPGLVTFESPLWFIFIGGGLHLMRIWVDYLRPQFTINGMLMSIEMLLFHISFSLLYFDFNIDINQFLIFITLGILILGGLHQILTVFFGIFYQIYRFFKSNQVYAQQLNKQLQNPSTKEIKEQKLNIQNMKNKTKLTKLAFVTENKQKQINPTPNRRSIKFEIKQKKLTISKTYYKPKKRTNLNVLNIQQAKKTQDYIQSEIETFDFQKRVKTVIKFPKFEKTHFQ